MLRLPTYLLTLLLRTVNAGLPFTLRYTSLIPFYSAIGSLLAFFSQYYHTCLLLYLLASFGVFPLLLLPLLTFFLSIHCLPLCLSTSLPPCCLQCLLASCGLPHSLPASLTPSHPASLFPFFPASLSPCLPVFLPPYLPTSLPPCLPTFLPSYLPASLFTYL